MALIDRLSSLVTRQHGGKPLPVEADLPENFVTSIVTARDRIPERVRASEPGWVHVSSLTAFCPRRLVLMRREDRPLIRSVTGGHRVMWRLGRAVEQHIREQFISGRNYRGILGRWSCPCSHTTVTGIYRSDVSCTVCRHTCTVYGEYTLRDASVHLIGNPDLLVDHDGATVIVEIKSMNKTDWEALTEPMGEHIFQAGMYYDLAESNLLSPHRKAVFVYCTKDFKFGSPYKEYHVDVATRELRNLRSGVVENLRIAMLHEQANALPPRVLCGSPQCSMAKVCPVATACFNLG